MNKQISKRKNKTEIHSSEIKGTKENSLTKQLEFFKM